MEKEFGMGFSMYLTLIYLVLFAADVFAFIKGKENKRWIPFILITRIMVGGVVVLGYLWLTSSM